MADIIISKRNESYLDIDCETGIFYELREHFTFEVPNARFTPKFRAGLWDGKICLLDMRFGTLPLGLTPELLEVSEKLGYTVEVKETQYGVPNEKDDVTYQDVEKWIIGLNLSNKNNELNPIKIEVRDYQIQTIFNCIKNRRQIVISSTGSGKSLIIYCLIRWYLEHGGNRVLLVVPNLGLIRQMKSDFADYSILNGFDVDSNLQVIAEGASKVLIKPIQLATWQGIYKLPSSWYSGIDNSGIDNSGANSGNGIDIIIGDECHQYKAEACRNIFDRSTETKYKFGFTGTLDKSTVNKLLLKGLIGDISKVNTTRDLIEAGHLSDIKIKCILLKYDKDVKKLTRGLDYQREIDFLCQNDRRNKFIRNLALSLKGNTLILFGRVETHGEIIYGLIKEKATTHRVHFIAGKVDADDRENIRNLVQNSDEHNIIVGSFGTVSTGLNIPRIHNIIFAAPSKSVIRVLQSIGRGLRKSSDKSHLVLYDIVDVLGSNSKPNYTMKHWVERLKIYTDEEFSYKIVEHEFK